MPIDLPTIQGLPEPEGIRAMAAAVTDAAPLSTPTFKARSLHDLSRDFAFFNHAALLTHGHLTVDPVVDYCESRDIPPDGRPILFPARRPFFSGIDTLYDPSEGRPCWDRTLLMMPKPLWPDLLAHLSAVGAVDPLRRNFFWACRSEFLITERDGAPPVSVTLFGLDANFGLFEFVRYCDDPDMPVSLSHRAARLETREFAAALFQGHSQPYRTIELEPKHG